MIFDKKYSKKLQILLTSLLIFLISGCGIYKPVDARKVDPNVKKRVEKNIQEGRGYRLFGGKQKGGGTTKTCLPASKIASMSKEERQRLVNAKQKSGAAGKYKRSSSTNVKGARKKGATLRDWFEKEDWRQVNDPSKKCGEK